MPPFSAHRVGPGQLPGSAAPARIYFWIAEDALRRADFSAVQVLPMHVRLDQARAPVGYVDQSEPRLRNWRRSKPIVLMFVSSQVLPPRRSPCRYRSFPASERTVQLPVVRARLMLAWPASMPSAIFHAVVIELVNTAIETVVGTVRDLEGSSALPILITEPGPNVSSRAIPFGGHTP